MKTILIGDRPSSVAPLQELMRREAKILATKARVSTFGGIKEAVSCGGTAQNRAF
jgi:hypothetical protein